MFDIYPDKCKSLEYHIFKVVLEKEFTIMNIAKSTVYHLLLLCINFDFKVIYHILFYLV